MVRSCLCTGGTAIGRCRQADTNTRARASTCWNLITRTLCFAIRLSSFTSTTPAEEEGRGKDGRQVMMNVADCHPAWYCLTGTAVWQNHSAILPALLRTWTGLSPHPSSPLSQGRKVVVTAWLFPGSCSFSKTSGGLLHACIGLGLHITASNCPEATFRWLWFWSVVLVQNEVKIICYCFVNNFSNSPAASASLEGSC